MADPLCPICRRPAPAAAPRPFCSVRCANVDLGRWLGGQYRIPGPPAELEDDESPQLIAPPPAADRS